MFSNTSGRLREDKGEVWSEIVLKSKLDRVLGDRVRFFFEGVHV